MPADEPSPLAGRCGSCAYFHSARLDPAKNVTVGDCSAGVWPPVRPELSTCQRYVASGTLTSKANAKARAGSKGAGGRSREGAREEDGPRAPRAPVEIEVDMDEATFRSVLREILHEELGISDAPLGDRWRGGELVLKPGKEGLQEKRIPIENFFSKVVMVRDKLRVLEQRINAHDKLAADEKVALQQYVTGAYGSLTTFNVLFRDEGDRFVGQKGGDKE